MPQPLVKELLRDDFWKAPAWWYKEMYEREMYYQKALYLSSLCKPILPLPKVYQGLPNPVKEHYNFLRNLQKK